VAEPGNNDIALGRLTRRQVKADRQLSGHAADKGSGITRLIRREDSDPWIQAVLTGIAILHAPMVVGLRCIEQIPGTTPDCSRQFQIRGVRGQDQIQLARK